MAVLMWKCERCGAQSDFNHSACWKCNSPRPENAAPLDATRSAPPDKRPLSSSTVFMHGLGILLGPFVGIVALMYVSFDLWSPFGWWAFPFFAVVFIGFSWLLRKYRRINCPACQELKLAITSVDRNGRTEHTCSGCGARFTAGERSG